MEIEFKMECAKCGQELDPEIQYGNQVMNISPCPCTKEDQKEKMVILNSIYNQLAEIRTSIENWDDR